MGGDGGGDGNLVSTISVFSSSRTWAFSATVDLIGDVDDKKEDNRRRMLLRGDALVGEGDKDKDVMETPAMDNRPGLIRSF